MLTLLLQRATLISAASSMLILLLHCAALCSLWAKVIWRPRVPVLRFVKPKTTQCGCRVTAFTVAARAGSCLPRSPRTEDRQHHWSRYNYVGPIISKPPLSWQITVAMKERAVNGYGRAKRTPQSELTEFSKSTITVTVTVEAWVTTLMALSHALSSIQRRIR